MSQLNSSQEGIKLLKLCHFFLRLGAGGKFSLENRFSSSLFFVLYFLVSTLNRSRLKICQNASGSAINLGRNIIKLFSQDDFLLCNISILTFSWTSKLLNLFVATWNLWLSSSFRFPRSRNLFTLRMLYETKVRSAIFSPAAHKLSQQLLRQEC